AAIEAILALTPDLVFLDVQMPGLGGFDVLERVSETHLPIVIFVTAYDQYALKAFDVHALDYLLKPFSDARFAQALARARRGRVVGRRSRRGPTGRGAVGHACGDCADRGHAGEIVSREAVSRASAGQASRSVSAAADRGGRLDRGGAELCADPCATRHVPDAVHDGGARSAARSRPLRAYPPLHPGEPASHSREPAWMAWRLRRRARG